MGMSGMTFAVALVFADLGVMAMQAVVRRSKARGRVDRFFILGSGELLAEKSS